MFQVPGCHTHEQLYESANSFIYRGIRLEDQHPLILKILRAEFLTPQQMIQLNNEYELTCPIWSILSEGACCTRC